MATEATSHKGLHDAEKLIIASVIGVAGGLIVGLLVHCKANAAAKKVKLDAAAALANDPRTTPEQKQQIIDAADNAARITPWEIVGAIAAGIVVAVAAGAAVIAMGGGTAAVIAVGGILAIGAVSLVLVLAQKQDWDKLDVITATYQAALGAGSLAPGPALQQQTGRGFHSEITAEQVAALSAAAEAEEEDRRLRAERMARLAVLAMVPGQVRF